ncbi:hypothetical protein GWI34_01320 [Actinomadura sp. DSM 109109]|nr:hypothetical protein [Actinomadura lepetitiana]
MKSTPFFRQLVRMALTVTAFTSTATALTTTPAWAAGHDVFLPGVPSPSVQPITGRNSGSIVVATMSGGIVTCVDTAASKALTITGTVRVGTGSDPIGSLNGLTFSNCTISGLSLVAVMTAQNLPWSFSSPGSTSSGVTPARLGNARIVLSIPHIACSATFQGSTSSNGFINAAHINPTSAGAASTLSLPISSGTFYATGVSASCPSSIVKWGDQVLVGGAIELRGVNSTANEGPTIT